MLVHRSCTAHGTQCTCVAARNNFLRECRAPTFPPPPEGTVNVVVYSLYGDRGAYGAHGEFHPARQYFIGTIVAADTLHRVLPTWEVWVYLDARVPEWVLRRLSAFPNVRLYMVDGLGGNLGMGLARFLAQDNDKAHTLVGC